MRLHSFLLNVANLELALQFPLQVMGAQLTGEFVLEGSAYKGLYGCEGSARLARFQIGREVAYFVEHAKPSNALVPEDSMSNDLWFQHVAIVVSDMNAAVERVSAAGCTLISNGPQTIPEWNEAAAGIRACYFRGPSGHPLELIWFPPGKGREIWQSRESLFLGIDHAAIAVSDTERSLRFYNEIPGMVNVGGSLNYGITQEELSGVPGARVRITAVRYPGDTGAGVEFLEYLSPKTGRTWPHEISALHVGRKMVGLEVADLEACLARLGEPSECAHGLGEVFGAETGAILADPDGHALLLLSNGFHRDA